MQDRGCPSSQSVLWHWLKTRYLTMSPEGWSEIPYQVTSSAWLADHYVAWIDKIALGVQKRVVIVEWGAGSGALAFRVLRRLSEQQDVVYVLCDVQPEMPSRLQAHPDLKPFLASGRLRLCVWDWLQSSDWLGLLSEWFDPDQHVFVMIFNYFIDALPADVWYVSPEGEKQAMTLIIEGAGTTPWSRRALSDMRVRLAALDAWHPTASWYASLLDELHPVVGGSAMYHVPVEFLSVLRRIKASLPVCYGVACDIPLRREPLSEPVSPYFVDGMLAGLVDFEILAQACAQAGIACSLGEILPEIELRLASWSWGAPCLPVTETISLPAYWWWFGAWIREKTKNWRYVDLLAGLSMSHYDASSLGALVDHEAGIHVPEAARAHWSEILSRLAQDVYWMHGSLDYLHLATLYRWHKDFDHSFEMLVRHARFNGYDGHYWYCMGYWLYDQGRYHDAVDAWARLREKDAALAAWVAQDSALAREKSQHV